MGVQLKALSIQSSDRKPVYTAFTDTALKDMLEVVGTKKESSEIQSSQTGVLFLHWTLAKDTPVPTQLHHILTLQTKQGSQSKTYTELIASTTVSTEVIRISPPLKGKGFLAGDSCCSRLHRRSLLPVNGLPALAQRFAVDWEQVDETGRIFKKPTENLKNATIYGAQIYAVADGTVVQVKDYIPDAVAGKFPENLKFDELEGNSVILQIAPKHFALYAHMKPGSIKVKVGDNVKRGAVLGLVGNSGHSLAPHLHFHMMDGPAPLSSNGLPYVLDSFHMRGEGESTQAFNEAESQGVPLRMKHEARTDHIRQYPLDLAIVDFD